MFIDFLIAEMNCRKRGCTVDKFYVKLNPSISMWDFGHFA